MDETKDNDRDEIIAAIREGLADVAACRTKPARVAILALARKYGIRLPEKYRQRPHSN
jgi:hypothetical protein